MNVVLQLIPVFEHNSQFQPSAIEMVDGQTSPPQLLTEADLISLMQKHGIGNVQSISQQRHKLCCQWVCMMKPESYAP